MERSQIQSRSFFSLLSFFSFLVLVATGLALFVEPHGRVAYWTDWTMLGLGKDQWDAIHVVSALVFLISATVHIYLNWRPLVRYLSGKIKSGQRRRRELAIALALTLLCTVGSAWGWPPFSWLVDLSETAKNAWTVAQKGAPPYGHAEQSSVQSLCTKMGLDPAKALQNLRAAGITVRDAGQIISQVARQNRLAPRQVFQALGSGQRASGKRAPSSPQNGAAVHDPTPHQGAGSGQPPPSRVQDSPQETQRPYRQGRRGGGRLRGSTPPTQAFFSRFSGRGLGRKTIEEVCRELGLDPDQGIQALAQQGVAARKDQTLKSVAWAQDQRPVDLLQLLCSGGGCQ